MKPPEEIKKSRGMKQMKTNKTNKGAIRHKHPIHAKSPDRDCTKCAHAKQIAPHEWECDAIVYDLKFLTCFVERENENGEQ